MLLTFSPFFTESLSVKTSTLNETTTQRVNLTPSRYVIQYIWCSNTHERATTTNRLLNSQKTNR